MENSHSKTLTLTYIALSAALIAICSWISIPTTVPFTLQTFGVFAALGTLGGRRGTLAILAYLLLGLVGLPVFSGFQGGPGVLLGTTGGYILGFLASALLYWGAVSLGLVSNFYILVSGTFPIFVQGFVQCLDPRIWVFTIVLIVVMAVVWYPFFKVYDNQLLAQEQENAAAASAEDAE